MSITKSAGVARSVRVAKKAGALAVGIGMAGTLAACGSSSDGDGGSGDSGTVTLVSHDSWAASKDVVAAFEEQSGYKLKVLEDGDAGQAVNKAILTKDNPQGDVFFGVDNTLLSRALDNGLFQPYEAKALQPPTLVRNLRHELIRLRGWP